MTKTASNRKQKPQNSNVNRNGQAINEKGIKMFACSLSQNGDRSNQRLFDHIFTFVVFLSIAILTKQTNTRSMMVSRISLCRSRCLSMVVTLHFAYNLYDGYFFLSLSLSRRARSTQPHQHCFRIEYTLDHCYVVSLFAHLTISRLQTNRVIISLYKILRA